MGRNVSGMGRKGRTHISVYLDDDQIAWLERVSKTTVFDNRSHGVRRCIDIVRKRQEEFLGKM